VVRSCHEKDRHGRYPKVPTPYEKEKQRVSIRRITCSMGPRDHGSRECYLYHPNQLLIMSLVLIKSIETKTLETYGLYDIPDNPDAHAKCVKRTALESTDIETSAISISDEDSTTFVEGKTFSYPWHAIVRSLQEWQPNVPEVAVQ